MYVISLCSLIVKPQYIYQSTIGEPVIHIKKNKEEVQQMLHKENYKKDIIDTIKDPSAFKWHLLNEITYDREMF